MADNALLQQSSEHPDGWGVGYYHEGSPHLIKSPVAAGHDNLFHKVSGIVASNTVIAHLRKATTGTNNIVNTHPFQYGPWIFAHNGNIRDFAKHRQTLLKLIAPELSPFILGESDSEVLFYLILTYLSRTHKLSGEAITIQDLAATTAQAMQDLMKVIGPTAAQDAPPTETFLTFLITNGDLLLSHHGGKELNFSTHKSRCSERASCPFFDTSCENATTARINHLLIASENLASENIFTALKPREIVGIGNDMHLFRAAY